ncbi:MAG TPA: putative Na+/H+ antiporter [Candidatus Didemnitutus sp.]|nr:putative Na+/H+ antiporter [Candidatus Didemnitutus sp.]
MIPLLLAEAASPAGQVLPRALESYPAPAAGGLWQTLADRIAAEPFNLWASLIFLAAILHTFITPQFRKWATAVESRHREGGQRQHTLETGEEVPEVSFAGQLLHFLGEVEAVFGLWVVALLLVGAIFKGWPALIDYVGHRVDYSEPVFVMIIMALASTRPITRLAERVISMLAALGGETIGASWLAILIFGPLLGSLITEPGAMTISAILLARQFYHYEPSRRLCYATIGLLFVNVSVGGTLTHFAAPPMIMVTGQWHWDTAYVFLHFGWRAMAGITVATLLYFIYFRNEFAALEKTRLQTARFVTIGGGAYIPIWIYAAQVACVIFAVTFAHDTPLLIGGFLFFMAFAQATAHHQKRLDLRSPLMVGFFLAALVVHGGLQAWWLEPVLKSLNRTSLFWGATFLTSFNDNAAITYLASLVPNLSDALKHAVVAGAVTGGGLTVIANAPNPAGQSILQKFFRNGVSPIGLAVAAIIPTLVMAGAFMLF